MLAISTEKGPFNIRSFYSPPFDPCGESKESKVMFVHLTIILYKCKVNYYKNTSKFELNWKTSFWPKTSLKVQNIPSNISFQERFFIGVKGIYTTLPFPCPHLTPYLHHQSKDLGPELHQVLNFFNVFVLSTIDVIGKTSSSGIQQYQKCFKWTLYDKMAGL